MQRNHVAEKLSIEEAAGLFSDRSGYVVAQKLTGRADRPARLRFVSKGALMPDRWTVGSIGEDHVRMAITDIYRLLTRPQETQALMLEGAGRYRDAGLCVGTSDLLSGLGTLRRSKIRFDYASVNGTGHLIIPPTATIGHWKHECCLAMMRWNAWWVGWERRTACLNAS